MAKHIPVGIDLGTSRSLIAYIDALGRPRVIENLDDQKKYTPSVIMFDMEGDEMVINVGEVAKRAFVARPGDVIRFVRSHMHDKNWRWVDANGREWTPSVLSSLILRKMKTYAERTLRENYELQEGEELTHAVITVPYCFGDLERERTKEAGEMAGFKVMSIIDEPVAAAIAFGLNGEKTQVTSLIYNFGGETFDIAVTNVDENGKIKVIATHGHRSLGGASFDQIICEYFKEEFQKVHDVDPLQDLRTYHDFMEKAENAKETLAGKDRRVDVPLSSGGKVLDLEFTLEKLEELIHPLLDVTIMLLEETLINIRACREFTQESAEYHAELEQLETFKDSVGEKLNKQDETNLLEKLRDNKRKELNELRISSSSDNSKKSKWEAIKTEEWGKIDRILLVGELTKIPLVQTMLKNHSGKIPQTLGSPDEVVALGAAAVSACEYIKLFPDAKDLPVVCGTRGPKKETVVGKLVSHSLGIKAMIPDTDKFINSKIIYKGAEWPASGQVTYTNASDNATSIEIQLLQGESEKVEFCQQVGKGLIIRGIPPMPAGKAKIKVILKYDEEDKLRITAIEETSGEILICSDLDLISQTNSHLTELKDPAQKIMIDALALSKKEKFIDFEDLVTRANKYSVEDNGDKLNKKHTSATNQLQITKDNIECTVFSPPKIHSGKSMMIQVFIHLLEKYKEAEVLAKEFDEDAVKRGFTSLSTDIERGTQLTFELSFRDIKVDDPIQKLKWQGRTESIEYEVNIPENFPVGDLIGKVVIAQESIPIGHIRFKIKVTDLRTSESTRDNPEPIGDAKNYENAFISYASQDRQEVLRRVQMLSATKIKFFQDILNLEPGDRWAHEIYKYIDTADVFYLFWSHAASKSEWVLKEIQYALARKAGKDNLPPEIVPIIIEKPPLPNPPDELRDLHFNDKIMYFIETTS